MAENGFLVGFVKRGKNSVDITQHLNIWNAKLLAIVLVLCLSACNVILRHDEGEFLALNSGFSIKLSLLFFYGLSLTIHRFL